MELWKQRNNALHTNKEHTPVQHLILQKKMTLLYEKHCTHQGNYKFLFKKSIPELKKQNQQHLERWIELANMIEPSNKINNMQRKKFGNNIKQYLPQASKPPDQ